MISEHVRAYVCRWLGLTRWLVLKCLCLGHWDVSVNVVDSYRHLNFNTFHKNYWMIRLLIYYALWMSTMRDLMGHYKARWRVRIISVSSRWTRSVIRGNFRQYIFCLHIVTLRLSSAVYRHSSITYSSSKRPIINSSTHLDSSPSSFNHATAMSTMATGQRVLPVGTAPVWCCCVTS